jgi:hypothetical protein
MEVDDGLGIRKTLISPDASESVPPLEHAARSNETDANPANRRINLEFSTVDPFRSM